ncbi:MAG TPA: multidrug ABC transporter ATP-binding protein [Anaerolineaceae bacterium]|jgi:ABC-2 type transport system ATP-binding protein|nr:multidrug ABC transporter ATP-binding protein [Anaerolineaceae bacterium]
MTNDIILSAKNITKAFKAKPVLTGINFDLPAKQIVAICGANGSGKSVFMRILSGLIRTDTGTVSVFGTQLGGKNEFPPSTGVHFDNSGLLLTETGWNNLLLLAMISNTVSKERIEEVIRLVNLDPNDKRPVRTYSTGMRQRLGIAQALMEDPQLLLLDEPTTGLDFDGQDWFHDLIRELQGHGKTILITSHSKEEIASFCDQAYVMAGGTLKSL